jgi:hypothetical protein
MSRLGSLSRETANLLGRGYSLLLLLVLLVACGPGAVVEEERATAVPTPTETPMPQTPFRVIAYVTGAVVPEVIPYDQLTHLNYAFLIPNADGTFVPLTNLWKLQKIVADAHAADVQVLISVGGWGWDAQFETLAADPVTRAAFVQNLTDFVTENDLDGADVDWEYPDPGPSSQNFLALIQELRQAMPDKLLTTAVVAYARSRALRGNDDQDAPRPVRRGASPTAFHAERGTRPVQLPATTPAARCKPSSPCSPVKAAKF